MSPLAFGLYKLVKIGVYPLTWIWILMVVVVVLLFRQQTSQRLRAARIAACSALALLYGLSAGPVSSYLAGMLEQSYPPYQPIEGQSHDAIVVLTGGLAPKQGARPVTVLAYSTLQRTICGVKAYSQGLSKKLVMSGGPFDAGEMAELAVKLGVPEQALLLEDVSRNTYESAKETQHLLGQRANILLVTSAIHVPRAVRLYRKQGLDVTPYPCGYQTSLRVWTLPGIGPSTFVPDVRVLSRSTAAIIELVGLAVYRLAGQL